MVQESDPGKRPVSDVASEYQQQVEFIEAIEDQDADKRENALILKFRLGAKRLCAKHFWRVLKDSSPRTESRNLADCFKLARSQDVNKLDSGEMTLDFLIAAITDLRWELNKLGELPPIEERSFAGHQLCIYWLLTKKQT